ncbi:hypothetical protein H0H92_014606 [Tricholoma furcatifolium]|nr:hypothetical protein H0H92_014606 [Tricholoma furcatifolium]
MSFPQQGMFYRIQSADLETCLELWNTSEERAVLRPSRETDLQQWLFVKQSGPGAKYKILAAATQSLRYPHYLSITAEHSNTLQSTVTLTDDTQASLWQISRDRDGLYALTTNGKDPQHETFLRVNEAGMVNNRSERWKITEFWSSVPQDTYRIRSLNGGALGINSNLNGLAVGPAGRDFHQEWLIEPKGNGNCVVSLKINDKEKVFLGWERGKNGFAQVAITKTPFEWFIRSLGAFTYS